MQELQVNVSDFTFTPLICATLINEILRGLLFQKNQIPYHFDWLRSVIERRRRAREAVISKSNFTFENHYKTVAATYDTLQNFKTSLSQAFSLNGNFIKQVVIMLGDTVFCAKEVFWIAVSAMEKGHIERNHILELERHLQKTLRDIFLSENLLDSIDASHVCTNTFIFIEKQISEKQDNEVDPELHGFQPCRPLEVHSKVAQMKINLHNRAKESNCCGSLTVFDDNQECLDTEEKYSKSPEDLMLDKPTVWYQFKQPIKGFKDCFKGKVSVCELW